MAPYFDGVEETIVIVPKKNGKSTLIAALILYHLLTTPDAECIVVAASREQAGIILRQSRKFIRNTPGLQRHFRVLQREILSLDDEGRARVLASDEDTADGVLPTLAIVDELHRHKTSELYAVLALAVGTTGGRMFTISTAGSSMDTPLGAIRRRAYEMPGFVRDEKRKRSYVRSEDGAFAFIEWSLAPDDDPNDMKLVKLVNPAPWKTLALLAKEKKKVTPWQWLRFGCGIWTEGEEPAVPPELWDGLADRDLVLEEGVPVWVGVAMGMRGVGSAVAVVEQAGDDFRTKVELLDGDASFDRIEGLVRAAQERYQVKGMTFTNTGFRRSAELLESEGLNVIELPIQGVKITDASAAFYKLLEEGKLHHDGDPDLRAHVMGARVKEAENGWRFHHDPNQSRPVAGLFAIVAACYMAQVAEPPPFVSVGWL